MLIEKALELVNEMSASDLKRLTRDELMIIVDGMNEQDRGHFFMEKNIKVFGGIDGYVNDFLNKVNLHSMNEQAKAAAIIMLNKMLLYPGISEAVKKRIENSLVSINYVTAPAAGGKRRLNRKTRHKKKGLKRSRVRR